MKLLKCLLLLFLLPVSVYAADDLSFASNPPAYIGIKLFILFLILLIVAPIVLLFEKGIKLHRIILRIGIACFIFSILLIPLSYLWDRLL